MARSIRAPLAILALLVGAGPALAQFGTLFGEPPPRPPSSVPMRQRPPVQPLPPPDDADPSVTPLPPPPGRAAPSAMAPARPNPSGFESQPLAPPPGGVADPGRPPSAPPQPASLPPGAGRETLATPTQSPPPEEAVAELPTQKVPNPTAVFSGLDKITGRITTFDVAINETVQFGALRVRPRACYTRLPTEAPNTTGFIEVDEVTLQGEVKRLFRGWMFASSPGLHGVEHSIYDVWLADCKGAQTAAVEEPAATPPPQPAAKPPAAAPAAPRANTPRQSAAPQQQQRRQSQSPGGAPAQRAPAQRTQQY